MPSLLVLLLILVSFCCSDALLHIQSGSTGNVNWTYVGNNALDFSQSWILPSTPIWGRPIMYESAFSSKIGITGFYETWASYLGVRMFPQSIEALNIHFGSVGFEWAGAFDYQRIRGMASLPLRAAINNGERREQNIYHNLILAECSEERLTFHAQPWPPASAEIQRVFVLLMQHYPQASLCTFVALVESSVRALTELAETTAVVLTGAVQPDHLVAAAHAVQIVSTGKVYIDVSSTTAELRTFLHRWPEDQLRSVVQFVNLELIFPRWQQLVGLCVIVFPDDVAVPNGARRLAHWVPVGGRIMTINPPQNHFPLTWSPIFELFSDRLFGTVMATTDFVVYERRPSVHDSGSPLKVHLVIQDRELAEIGTMVYDIPVTEFSPDITGKFRLNRFSCSVLMPCYNCADTVERTLASIDAAAEGLVSNVPSSSVVIVVVNDGSKDNSVEVMQRFRLKFSTLKVVNAPSNIGIGNALNLGMQHIDTEFTFFCDADDTFFDNHFIVHMDLHTKHPNNGYVQSQLRVTAEMDRKWIEVISATLLQVKSVRTECLRAMGQFKGWRWANDVYLSLLLRIFCPEVVTSVPTVEYACYAENTCGKQLNKFNTDYNEQLLKQQGGGIINYDEMVEALQSRYVAMSVEQQEAAGRFFQTYPVAWGTYQRIDSGSQMARPQMKPFVKNLRPEARRVNN